VDQRAEFRGLDVYSLRSSIAAVLKYLDRVDPDAAKTARKRYGWLTPWQADPAWYVLVMSPGPARHLRGRGAPAVAGLAR
jgi:hypothetical protein